MPAPDWRIDHDAHELHYRDRTFPCDRCVEAMALWQDHALLLSSDTDCLSLWDAEGLVRIARVGVYPQDMALWDGRVLVCGGADCRLHLLTLPDLAPRASLPLPGMPERIAWGHGNPHILVLVTDLEPCTQVIRVDPERWTYEARLTLPGIPGAIAADDSGLWIGVSEQVIHLPDNSSVPDMVIEGIGLAGRIETVPGGVRITDSLTSRTLHICT